MNNLAEDKRPTNGGYCLLGRVSPTLVGLHCKTRVYVGWFVCLFAAIYHKFLMHTNFSRKLNIGLVHFDAESTGKATTARVQRWQLVVETPQVEVHTATYFLFVTAATDRPLTASYSQTIQFIMTC